MDGPAVLARCALSRRNAPIPVIFLTARTDLAARQRFIALGAAGVLAKPFDPVGFAAEVRRFVAVEGVLRPARESFMRRLKTDASALSVCRSHLRENAARNTGDDQRHCPFARRSRRHLRLRRHYVRVGGAVGSGRKKSCGTGEADRGRARRSTVCSNASHPDTPDSGQGVAGFRILFAPGGAGTIQPARPGGFIFTAVGLLECVSESLPPEEYYA